MARTGRSPAAPTCAPPPRATGAAGACPPTPGLIVAGPGSKPLLYGLLLAIGGGVVVPQPSWVSYAAQTRLTGAEPIFVPTPPGEGGVPDPEVLREAVTVERAAGREVRCLDRHPAGQPHRHPGAPGDRTPRCARPPASST